jgi:4-amino-4-deoxy-L-arabinose transferase-like glycosyltransferase
MQTSEGLTATQVPAERDRTQIDRSDSRLIQLLVLVSVVVSGVYVVTLGVPRLFDQIDGQYAGAAREMIARGDWLTPTQDGIPRLQKPPLVYWCEIVALRVLGMNEFAARLPVALVTVGWFLATAALAERISKNRIHGICSALILATFLGTYLFGHLVMPEPFSALFLVCTFYNLVRGFQCELPTAQDHWLLLAWFCIALGTLSKGLHALLIPLAIGCASCVLKKPTRDIWCRFFLRPHGWILFLAIVAPWYIAIEWRYPGSFADQVGNEQLGNLLNHRWPVDSDRVPFVQLLLEHIAFLFPWSFFLPAAIIALWRSRESWLEGEWYLLGLLLFVNVVGILFAKIQDYYLMISWPAVAIGVASLFTFGRNLSRRFFSIPGWFFVVTGVVGVLISSCLSWRPIETGPLVDTVTHGRTVWEGIGGLSPEGLSGLLPLLLIASCALALAGLAIIYFVRQKRFLAIVGSCVGLMMVVFLASNRSLYLVEDEFSSARVASTIQRLGGTNYQVVCEFEANDLTSLFFYLPHTIHWLNANPEMEFATRNLGIGRNLYLSEGQFKSLWGSQQRMFLITSQRRLERWRHLLPLNRESGVPVATVGTKIVLMNR